MEENDYINEKIKEYAKNIDEFEIGQMIIDNDNKDYIITNKTLNSIEIFMKRKTDKGIDCKQWFDMREFNMKFKKK